jgi:hypothetical protein
MKVSIPVKHGWTGHVQWIIAICAMAILYIRRIYLFGIDFFTVITLSGFCSIAIGFILYGLSHHLYYSQTSFKYVRPFKNNIEVDIDEVIDIEWATYWSVHDKRPIFCLTIKTKSGVDVDINRLFFETKSLNNFIKHIRQNIRTS